MKVLFHITKIQIAQMKTPEGTCLYLYFYVFDLIMTDEKQFCKKLITKGLLNGTQFKRQLGDIFYS